MNKKILTWAFAIGVPLFYLVYYTPYGMDTTDFGYFYAYAWRILQGQAPYRDFFYIKPAFPLYWHAFWLWLTPHEWQILAGKAGFCVTLLTAAWLGAFYLRNTFKLDRLDISLPLLATCGFVFGIHGFPHMPWHTADGVLFCSASLFATLYNPALSGVFCGIAMLCKQSFALLPLAIIFFLFYWRTGRQIAWFIAGCMIVIATWTGWLIANNAWQDFRSMTTGQLDIGEAIDAGILIYLRQNWLIPSIALLPWLGFKLFRKRLYWPLQPGYCYLACLAFWYLHEVFTKKIWIGYGASWPTLWLSLGAVEIVFAGFFLKPYISHARPSYLAAGSALLAPILAAWSVAISGGYKIPAMFAVPLVFAFLAMHSRFFGQTAKLLWATLITGLIIFWAGYQYPYVFPERPLKRSDLVFDAGEIYPQAHGVKVDKDMYERLAELKELVAKYGPNYKTLPGFSFAYYLNGDQPVIGSDWLIDWEINGQTNELYRQLCDNNVIVFMERDQLDTEQADGYDRAGYTVPQRVRHHWQIIGETPHFVIFRRSADCLKIEQTNPGLY